MHDLAGTGGGHTLSLMARTGCPHGFRMAQTAGLVELVYSGIFWGT